MLKVEMIGNLGADAEIKDHQGSRFVSFRVAHAEKWTDRATGQIVSRTVWASCTMNGDGGQLTQYLKQGTKVFIRGSMSMNVFSSALTHQMEAGLNISVWELELCSSKPKEENKNNDSAPF